MDADADMASTPYETGPPDLLVWLRDDKFHFSEEWCHAACYVLSETRSSTSARQRWQNGLQTDAQRDRTQAAIDLAHAVHTRDFARVPTITMPQAGPAHAAAAATSSATVGVRRQRPADESSAPSSQSPPPRQVARRESTAEPTLQPATVQEPQSPHSRGRRLQKVKDHWTELKDRFKGVTDAQTRRRP